MQCKVYRSLDKSALFFGMRGRFSLYFFVFLIIVLVLSFLVGVIFSGIVGVIVFVVLGLVDYFFILSLQSSSSERNFSKRMAAGQIPEYIHVKPVKVRDLLDNSYLE